MEETADRRLDTNFAPHLLLQIAQERSLSTLLERLVTRALERPDMACLQVWLLNKGDRCESCTQQDACADRAHCLHLVASKGKSLDGSISEAPHFLPGNRRLPLGISFIGKAARTGEQIMHRDLTKPGSDEELNDWMRAEEIMACGATPIKFKGEVLGIIAGYTRERISDEAHVWGKVFAEFLGAAIANARAFEEIENLKAQLELQNTYLQEEVIEAKAFGELIGQSDALRQVVTQIDLVAPTDASVLIFGETGTGKELVAREIHRRSPRKERPLVRVNCASIPRELYESEFFGHVKGAFTGALRDRPGRFETAEGGTLFLDEVGEIPLELQGKLLRVLQEKRYERVGDDRTRLADVRIIGATNRDLKQEVAAGRFRQDLFYRLNVFPIQVATLRERREDIPLLAKHFSDLAAREMKCPSPRLTRAAITQLEAYHWPGNIRELRNVIQRAVILARGGALQFELPVTYAAGMTDRHRGMPSPVRTDASPGFQTDAEMRERDRENLVAALQHANWKVMGRNGAAELLGVKPTTLFSRMKKYGIKAPAQNTLPV